MSIRFSVISNSATYQLSRSVNPMDEGAQVTITLTTTGVQNGQSIPYAISGTGIDVNDFVGLSSLTGAFVVQNGTASFTLTTSADMALEGTETFTVALTNDGIGAMITVDINDTSAMQPEDYWINTIGSSNGVDEGLGVTTDADGNIYVVGYARAPGTDTQDALILKFNAAGTLLWQRAWGNYQAEALYDVAVDSTGNVHVVGYGFAEDGLSNGILIAKINSSGTFVWQRRLESAGDDRGYGIGLDSSGNVYVAGYGNAVTEAVFAKYNSAGTLQWKNKLTGSGAYYGFYNLAADGAGNSYMIGRGQDESTIVVKCDTTGAIVWQKAVNINAYDYRSSIVVDSTSNVYITGYQSISTAGSFDAITMKFDSTGTLAWQRRLGGAGDDRGCDIALDSTGNVYVAGHFATGSTGPVDAFVVKYNSAGTLVWQRKLSGINSDYGYGVTVNAAGSVVLVASQNSQTVGSWDVLVAKLPGDGSKIGTYGNFTIAASTLTDAAATLTVTNGTMTKSASTMSASTLSMGVSTPTFAVNHTVV